MLCTFSWPGELPVCDKEGISGGTIYPVCVVLNPVPAQDVGGDRQGESGAGAGHTPRLRHSHDVAPGVDWVAVPTQSTVLN